MILCWSARITAGGGAAWPACQLRLPSDLRWPGITRHSAGFVGAMREVIEQAPVCALRFLQGAPETLVHARAMRRLANLGSQWTSLGYAPHCRLLMRCRRRLAFRFMRARSSPAPTIGTGVIAARLGCRWCRPRPGKSASWVSNSLSPRSPVPVRMYPAHQDGTESKARAAGDLNKVPIVGPGLSDESAWRPALVLPAQRYPYRLHVGFVGRLLWIRVPVERSQTSKRLCWSRFPAHPFLCGNLNRRWHQLPPRRHLRLRHLSRGIAAVGPGSADAIDRIRLLARSTNVRNGHDLGGGGVVIIQKNSLIKRGHFANALIQVLRLAESGLSRFPLDTPPPTWHYPFLFLNQLVYSLVRCTPPSYTHSKPPQAAPACDCASRAVSGAGIRQRPSSWATQCPPHMMGMTPDKGIAALNGGPVSGPL